MRTPRHDPLDRLRQICLALPEATEKLAWGEPTFRICNKLFAMFTDNHHGDGRVALWCKAPMGVQEILVGAAPQKFFRPPYVGHKGWIGVRLDIEVDWNEVTDLLKDSYQMTAPKPRAAPRAQDRELTSTLRRSQRGRRAPRRRGAV